MLVPHRSESPSESLLQAIFIPLWDTDQAVGPEYRQLGVEQVWGPIVRARVCGNAEFVIDMTYLLSYRRAIK